MPEKGWYSLTVRKETAERIRAHSKEKGITVDVLLNQLIDNDLKRKSDKGFMVCSVCGMNVKAENLDKHMARVHPRQWKK